MSIVLQLSKPLLARPEPVSVEGVTLRHFLGEVDIAAWLTLREAAFARQRVGVRQWTTDDFRSELLDKPWWSPERMWLAESTDPATPELIGSVIWADRAAPDEIRPAIHWLVVAPGERRRGVARALIAALEASCWDAGYRQIWLETHSAWTAASQFYARQGYEPA